MIMKKCVYFSIAAASLFVLGTLGPVLAQDIVTNGDFTGSTYGDPGSSQIFPSGWTASGDFSYPNWVYQSNGGYFYGPSPNSTAHVEIGGSGASFPDCTITQTLTTIPGETYAVSFYYFENYVVGGLRMIWDGNTLFSKELGDLYTGKWTKVTFNVKATTSSTVLEFDAYDWQADVGLGGVSVVATTADAGKDQQINSKTNARVKLDGSGSSDAGGDKLTYVWAEGGSTIVAGVRPSVVLAPGIHNITLTVTDPFGSSSSDTVTISIGGATAIKLDSQKVQHGVAKTIFIHLRTTDKHQIIGETLSIYVDGDFVGTVVSDNPSVFTYTAPNSLSVGIHDLKVVFAGNGGFLGSQTIVPLTVRY